MVHSPYTLYFVDAFTAAHVGIGVALMAILWWMRPRPAAAFISLLAALLLVTLTPQLGDFLRGLGVTLVPTSFQRELLLASSCLVVIAFAAMRRFVLAIVGCAVAVLCWKLSIWIEEAHAEICALHLVWLGMALGFVKRRMEVTPTAELPDVRAHRKHDVVIFVLSTLAAALTAIFVLQRADGSADEWAYTWQASVFAKGHIYATPPPCENAFQNFYVFESLGRMFAQYTPGWPYFMTPFVALGVPWLAGPFAHGLLAVGVARVARSAVRLDGRGTEMRVAAAGWVAAFVATMGTTILLTGASRYSHVFVAALFAWSVEAAVILRTPNLDRSRQLRWGVVLGSCVGLMGAARPADGATLSMGVFLYFAHHLVRGRIGWHAFVYTAASLFFWGGLTLVVLRLQLSAWFTTGYSLDKFFHPWAVVKYAWPHKSEIKYGLPLATGSYAWFPCSLALGFAGVLSLRRKATGILVMLLVGFAFFETYYQYIDLGRGYDWGYGPRYTIPFVVLMAVGTGVVVGPLFESALRRVHDRSALAAAGPFAVAGATALITLVRLWPLLYPGVWVHVHQHDSLNEKIRQLELHDAVVMTIPGATGFDVLDLTENLPLDLYPNQDVLIAVERKPEFTQCVRAHFPRRAIYRAAGNPVTITPY